MRCLVTACGGSVRLLWCLVGPSLRVVCIPGRGRCSAVVTRLGLCVYLVVVAVLLW